MGYRPGVPPPFSFAPPGWGYDPSAWGQRLPIVGLAFVGFLVAGYLVLYQWNVLDTVWEPFFGDEGLVILDSSFSGAALVAATPFGGRERARLGGGRRAAWPAGGEWRSA